jgi:hypothetical protein
MQFSSHPSNIRKMSSKCFSGGISQHDIGKERNVTSSIAIGDGYITPDIRLGMKTQKTFEEHLKQIPMKNAKRNVYHFTEQRPAVKSVKADITGLFRGTSDFHKIPTCENI